MSSDLRISSTLVRQHTTSCYQVATTELVAGPTSDERWIPRTVSAILYARTWPRVAGNERPGVTASYSPSNRVLATGGFQLKRSLSIASTLPYEGHVLHLDALEFLRNVSDEAADLVFLDPPFNIGKAYGSRSRSNDSLPETVYSEYMTSVLLECCRVMKPGAALYMYHLPSRGIQFGAILQQQLDFRHWIAVSMKNGFARGNRLYPAHYALLYFTKGTPAVFRRPKVQPLRCRHCDGYIRDYGGYVQHVENGINLSDVWDDLSPVRHNKYKTRSANELPVKMLQRVVSISGCEGGLLVDPFAGAGTSAVAARAAGMRYLLNDRDMRTVRGITARLNGPCEHGNGG